MNYNESVKKQQIKTAILEKLMESIMIGEVDCKEIENLSSSVKSPNDAAELISKIKRVIKSRKNSILVLAYHQSVIFKRFKENSMFTSAVRVHLRISSKSTINFKIGIVQFIHDYPKMKKSSISLHFLKNNFRIIKEVCREHSLEFQ